MTKLKPKLRFPEFSDEWEELRISQLIKNLQSGVNVNSVDEPIISEHQFGILKTSCFNSGIFYPSENKSILEEELIRAKLNPTKGSIIISRMNTPQLVGESAYVDRDYTNLFIPDRLWLVNINHLGYSKFISYILSSNKTMTAISNIASGTSGSMKNISIPNFQNIVLSLPTLPEQTKIAKFLTAFDEKIQALKEKKRLLEEYKKGLMLKIFSQELRFKQDDGSDFPDWEENVLSKLFEIKAGGDIKPQNFSEKYSEKFKYSVYSNSEKEKGLFGFSDIFKIDKESITITGRGALGIANARYEKYYPIVRLLVLIPKIKFDVKFGENIINQIDFFIESTGVPQLTVPQVSDYIINCPQYLEQQKIAKFLISIDEKIEKLGQQIKDALTFKKGLLQQMFV